MTRRPHRGRAIHGHA